MKIVGIIGYAGSGKGTVADVFAKNANWVKCAYADPLKDVVAALFRWPRELLEGDTPESREYREKVNQYWADLLEMPGLTPRKILQQFGSEVLRDHFHNDIWVKHMESRIDLESLATNPKNIVIPDCRFENEAESIRKRGGIIIKVVSPFQVLNTEVHSHVSEQAHLDITPNFIIHNIGTMEELTNKASALFDYIENGLDRVFPDRASLDSILFEEMNAMSGALEPVTKNIMEAKKSCAASKQEWDRSV